MQFRKFGNTGFEISALGFGAMRLPVANVPFDGPEPDLEPAVELLCRGFEAGINYVDTAYFYLNGWSEIAVGRDADFTVLSPELDVLATWSAGENIYAAAKE